MMFRMKTIWRAITIQHKRFDEERVKAQAASGVIQRTAKKNIHLLVHGHLTDPLEEVRALKGEVSLLLLMVKKNPLLHHVGAIDDALEEYVELAALTAFLENNPRTIAPLVKDIEADTLMAGIADATGELVRVARSAMDAKKCEAIHATIADVYHHLLDMEVSRNGKLRSKTEDVHRNLLRVEEILFDIRVRAHSSAG